MVYSIQISTPIPSHYGQDFLMGWALRELTVMAPLIFGIFLRGVRKIGYFCGGRQGYCVSTFDLFSFLLELIRHSDLAFQTQRKGTSVCGV